MAVPVAVENIPVGLLRSEKRCPGRQVEALGSRHPVGTTAHLSFFIHLEVLIVTSENAGVAAAARGAKVLCEL